MMRPAAAVSSGLFLRRLISTNAKSASASSNVGIPVTPRSAHEDRQRRFLRWGVTSLGLGAVLGVAYGYKQIQKMRTYIANPSESVPFTLAEMPPFTPSRSVVFPADTSGLKLTLFQYQTCPFCCKVRATLDFLGISYDIIEVNPVLRSQIKWSKTYKKVPILVVQTPQGEILQLNDSSMIISALYSLSLSTSNKTNNDSRAPAAGDNSLHDIVKYYPVVKYNDDNGRTQTEIMNKYFLMMDGDPKDGRTKENINEERKWRCWADSVFVHTLSPNIYRTLPEAIDSFKYFSQVGEWERNFPAWERYLVIYVGAVAMWMIGKRLQKRYHLKEDVRLSLFETSDEWMKTIARKGGEFMGGKSPNLSDLAVFGVLSSIEGCAAFGDLMRHSQPLEDWYGKIKSHLRSNSPQVHY